MGRHLVHRAHQQTEQRRDDGHDAEQVAGPPELETEQERLPDEVEQPDHADERPDGRGQGRAQQRHDQRPQRGLGRPADDETHPLRAGKADQRVRDGKEQPPAQAHRGASGGEIHGEAHQQLGGDRGGQQGRPAPRRRRDEHREQQSGRGPEDGLFEAARDQRIAKGGRQHVRQRIPGQQRREPDPGQLRCRRHGFPGAIFHGRRPPLPQRPPDRASRYRNPAIGAGSGFPGVFGFALCRDTAGRQAGHRNPSRHPAQGRALTALPLARPPSCPSSAC